MGIKITHTTRYETDDGFSLRFEPIADTVSVTKTDTGYDVRYISQDNDPISPSEDGDDELFLIHYHRDFWVEKKDIISEDDLRDWYQGEKIKQLKDYFIFSVAALIHSGVWLSLSQSFSSDPGGWDTSHVGAVLASKKEFETRDRALRAAESHIELWNMYLGSDVYGCIVERFSTEKEYIDHDSCWGFHGLESAEEELVGFEG